MARQFALVTETLINNNLNDTVISQSTKLSSKVLFTTYSHFFTQVFNKKKQLLAIVESIYVYYFDNVRRSQLFSPPKKKVFLTNSNFYTSKIRLFFSQIINKKKD